MQNLKWSWVLLIAAVLLSGCIDEETPTEGSMTGMAYTGVIPCADCEGIAYKLMLKEGHRFETTSVYIGKSNRTFTERGEWTLRGDSLIILNKSDVNPRQFKIKNEQLIMLDQQGQEVTGSLSKMYVLSESDTSKTDGRWQERRSRGIDFRAAGNEPSWSLDIDFDKMIAFKALNGDSIATPVPQMQQDSATKARVWQAEVESGAMRVEIFPTGCVDDMSGEVFSYHVQVNHDGQQYSGCGNFINERYKLNDFWELESLDGESMNGEKERKIPALQFDVAQKKVYGNTGCNQLNGNISAQDSSLGFSKMVTTKMACPGNREARFLEALQNVRKYEIADGELLLLSQNSDTLLTLRRAE